MRPKQIRLGYGSIPIHWHDGPIDVEADNRTAVDSPNDGDNGMCILIGPRRIHLSKESYDCGELLLHEALHYAWRNHGYHRMFSRESEELLITGMAQSVVELLRRNKGLAEWLVNPDG